MSYAGFEPTIPDRGAPVIVFYLSIIYTKLEALRAAGFEVTCI
jgi:hypothetical protein